MRQRNYKLLYILLGISMTMVLLLTAVEMVAFNLNHYMSSFEKYGIVEATGMDKENLRHTAEDLMNYLRDNKEELDTEAVVYGELREVYGEREKHHMVDVKDLFIAGRGLRNFALAAYIISLILVCYLDRGWKKGLARTLLNTAIANGILLFGLYILMQTDFTKYFDYFHYIFFDNDLWILDPKKEILIQMLPEGFFYDTAIKIIAIFVGSMTVFGIAGFWGTRRLRKYR